MRLHRCLSIQSVAHSIDIRQYMCHHGVMTTLTAPLADLQAACCSPVTREVMSTDAASTLSRALKALADPARLRLLSMVAAHADGEACVCDLTEPLGLAQPTVSHHLKVLREAGWVTTERRGSWVYYSLDPSAASRFRRLGLELSPAAVSPAAAPPRALPVIQPGAQV